MTSFARARSRVPIVDESTVAEARAGDPDATGRLATAVFRRLLAFYRYSGLSIDEAEDLAADAMETVVSRLGELRKPNSFEAWVWAIGRTKLRGFLRKERRPPAHEPMTPAADGPADRLIAQEEHAAIRSALTSLSPRDKELLWLREVEELSFREIASRVGASSGTVRVACMRARRRLQRAYEERLPVDEGD